MTTLYEVLGVNHDATESEIKRAYRSLAQRNHPDKGGSREAFQAIQKAYDILSDPEKRARYDDTGEEPSQAPRLRDIAIHELASLLAQTMARSDVVYTDLVLTMIKQLGQQVQQTESNRKVALAAIAKNNEAIKRIVAKGDGNILAALLGTANEAANNQLKELDNLLMVLAEMKKVLDDYEYKIDARPSMTSGSTIFGTTTGTYYTP
jgi:curved DNA-binding protein CbpA